MISLRTFWPAFSLHRLPPYLVHSCDFQIPICHHLGDSLCHWSVLDPLLLFQGCIILSYYAEDIQDNFLRLSSFCIVSVSSMLLFSVYFPRVFNSSGCLHIFKSREIKLIGSSEHVSGMNWQQYHCGMIWLSWHGRSPDFQYLFVFSHCLLQKRLLQSPAWRAKTQQPTFGS